MFAQLRGFGQNNEEMEEAMELTDTQLNYFVNNRLKLPKGKRAEYLAQVDHLIERFSAAADGDKLIDIKKFLKTGSLRKGTVLRPRGDIGVDADVAVFLKHVDNRLAEAYRLADLRVRFLDETGAFIYAKPFRSEAYAKCSPPMHEIRRDGVTL